MMPDLRKSVAGLWSSRPARRRGGDAETLKVAMGSDVKILDPIWSTAYIQRDFGYMVWDVLFALDDKLAAKPQMVETWDVSPDQRTWTFTLRDEQVEQRPAGHGGRLHRLDQALGRPRLAGPADAGRGRGLEAVDDRTFRMKMKEPYGLVLASLGKASSSAPFMMPKKTAETSPTAQIKVEDVIGSGPSSSRPRNGSRARRSSSPRTPRARRAAEPPSGMAGGKVAKVDRVEWLWIADPQTQVNALQDGEIDVVQAPPHDLLPLLAKDKNIRLVDSNPLGSQYEFRFNTVFKPFDNPKIRHAAMVAFGQEDFLRAAIGDPAYYKLCKAPFVCGTPLGSDEGMQDVLEPGHRARRGAAEGGRLRRHAGRVAAGDRYRRPWPTSPGRQGAARGGRVQGRSAASWTGRPWSRAARARSRPTRAAGTRSSPSPARLDILNPVMANLFNASCEKAPYGWPCDALIEKLRDRLRARRPIPPSSSRSPSTCRSTGSRRRPSCRLGQLYQPVRHAHDRRRHAARPATVFWNITKK